MSPIYETGIPYLHVARFQGTLRRSMGGQDTRPLYIQSHECVRIQISILLLIILVCCAVEGNWRNGTNNQVLLPFFEDWRPVTYLGNDCTVG